jgi:predicted dehydrogenase
MHVEASYLQGWLALPAEWQENPKRLWRLSTKHGSAGTLGDLGCHIIDMATFLCGPIAEVYTRMETYAKPGGTTRVGEFDLDANDGFISTVTFAGGGLGTIHSTRWGTGYSNREFIRVYGDAGTIDIDYQASQHVLRLYSVGNATWSTIECGSSKTNYRKFVESIQSGDQDECDFANGYLIQKYMDACVRSNHSRTAIAV